MTFIHGFNKLAATMMPKLPAPSGAVNAYKSAVKPAIAPMRQLGRTRQQPMHGAPITQPMPQAAVPPPAPTPQGAPAISGAPISVKDQHGRVKQGM